MQAHGALCLAALCGTNNIRHPAICELIDHLLDLLIEDNLPAWEARGTHLGLSGLGDPIPHAVEAVLPIGFKEPFSFLVCYVVEIGLADMYTAPSERPQQFLRQAIELTSEYGAHVPNIDDVLPSDAPECDTDDPWGSPYARETRETLRNLCAELLSG